MRLQKLELKGFKSFADQTVINFNKDVIGIVGPNGAGKSNIVDAVRWVLGEQKSKHLRLEKMSNVIFNGSKKRKKSGMASVSLTFENTKNILPTEYQTVTITRVLYQSGESEYKLNGISCRLKDIRSLFLDTGIGSNSYAIIALGMVDDLLNDKENSRRRMFEQAAGISKYKKRKRETLLKLKNTTEDLDRIEDLLYEIDNQLKQLEKQAKRTKRYYELKEQYKSFSIELATYKLSDYKDRYKTLEDQITKETDHYRGLEVKITEYEANLEKGKKQNLDKEKLLSEKQRDLNDLISTLRDKEGERKMKEQKVQFLNQSIEKLSASVDSASGRVTGLRQSIEQFSLQLAEAQGEEQENAKSLDEAKLVLEQIRSNHSDIKAELEGIVSQQQEYERAIYELEKSKAINASQKANNEREIEAQESGMTQRKGEVKVIEAQLKALTEEEESKAKHVDGLEREEAQRLEDVRTTDARLDQVRKELAKVNRTLDSKQNEYKLTKSMVDNLEGFPESIKFLQKQKDWSNSAPLLSDLIYVDEKYRIAIENFLGPYLNYYVVPDMAHAMRGVQLLGNAQKGKANFFILSQIPDPGEVPLRMLPDAQEAIELVKVDAPYRSLFLHLLHDVWITEHEEPMIDAPDGVRILSRSGKFVQGQFSLSGGSVGLFEGKKIGRKKNLQVLDGEIKKLDGEQKQLDQKLRELQGSIERLKANVQTEVIKKEREILSKMAQQKVSLMTKLENHENFMRDARERITSAQTLIHGLQNQMKSIEESLALKSGQLSDAKNQISTADETYRKVAEELSMASATYNQQNIEFIRHQNKVAALRQELTFRENQLKETTLNLGKDNEAIARSQEELSGLEVEIVTLKEALVKDYELKKEKEAVLTEAEQQYFKGRGGLTEIEENLRNLNRSRNQSQLLVNQLKEKFTNLKLEFTGIGERLKIEFGVDMQEVMKREPEGKLSPEDLELKVEKLQKRLNNYGEINPMAVEAYDEMLERHTSISTQRDDILEAKKSLMETIDEIETTATQHFMEAFNQVRGYFVDVFRSLFSADDKCDLVLLEPENPLESRIEIIAKPKGKRPLSINQLSGGEKTLTATALLFSLYLLKPAPFCIFDEVDAPLDDANIEKFNNIIRDFSKDSQFIIVTHNKLTMAAVDVIYGVFMQDQGISSVAAVDFTELDHEGVMVTTGA